MPPFFIRLLNSLEKTPLTLATALATFVALIIVRILVENGLLLFPRQSFFFFFFEFSHTFLFFAFAFLILFPVTRFFSRTTLRETANFLLFGFLIILTPPLIDTIIFRGDPFWSFYEFDGIQGLFFRYFTLFGDTPHIGITYGVRVEVVVVTWALGIYTYLKTQRVVRALLAGLTAYSILFVLGTFPSWLTLLTLGFREGFLSIDAQAIARLFLTPEPIFARGLNDFRSVLNVKMSLVFGLLSSGLAALLLFRFFPVYFWALVKNARVPQLFYHAGLLTIGMLLALHFAGAPTSFSIFEVFSYLLLVLATWCAWLASVSVNDWYDRKIDALTNPQRPLVEKTMPESLYATFGALFFFLSLLFSGIVSFSAMALLLAYQALAYLYSAPPFRLKRVPIIATALAALAGVLVITSGFLTLAPVHSLGELPLSLLLYLFVAYSVALPIKDLKDIEGDALDHVYTIPVLLGEERAQKLLGSLVFLLFAASPVFLHLPSLFVPAFLFGSLAFWALQKSNKNEVSFFAHRKLPGIILALIACHGLCIVMLLR